MTERSTRKCCRDDVLLPVFFLFVALTVSVSGVHADTVYLKDGSAVDGVVTSSGAGSLVVKIGSGEMTFPAADVLRIEKNDKKGDTNRLTAIMAKQHQDALYQRTGLTAQQRDKVRAAVDPLWSPDEAQRNAARKRLVAMNKEMPIFQYVESYLPYSKGLIVPELMQTLVDIDPPKAKDVLQRYIQNRDPANRAKALELIGAYKNAEDTETLAQGLVDLEPSVRIAAAHAVAEAGATRATPVLIEGLKNTDPKVQNATRDALVRLWSKDGTKADFKTAEEWSTFWAGKAGAVKDALDPASLTPLVTNEDLAQETASHDE